MTLLFRNTYFLFELGEVYKPLKISGCGIQGGGQPVARLRALTKNSLPLLNLSRGSRREPRHNRVSLPLPPRLFKRLAVKTYKEATLTLALDGTEWSASRSGPFTPGKEPDFHWRAD
jgi:hypothetical protein